MSNYLSKAEILSAQDTRFEEVEVPEWGGVVRLRAMGGTEKDAFEASLTNIRRNGNGKVTQTPNLVNVRAKLLARTIVDENGNFIFDETDIEALGKKSAAALDRVVEVAKRMNRMNAADMAELGEKLKNDQPAG